MPEQKMIIQEEDELDKKMQELMKNDATVYAAYRTGEMLGMSKMKLYMNMVLLLANEKKHYFEMAVEATNLSAQPIPPFQKRGES